MSPIKPSVLAWIALIGLLAAAPAVADGRTPVVLPISFDVSPDGMTVAFSWRDDLWQVPVEGGVARRLTSHSARDHTPRYSPDGRELAFVSTRFPGGQVFIMPARGGKPRQITYHTDGYRLEDWYPDGSALLVSASRDDHWRHATRFYRADPRKRSAHRRIFNAHGRDGCVSPDGKRVLFVREGERWWRKGYRGERSAQIWLHDLEKNTYQKLSRDRIPHEWPMWDPRGGRFYYVSEQDGTRNLFAMELSNGNRTQLTHFKDDGVTFPCVSANGRAIVFRRLCDLYLLRPDTDAEPVKIAIEYAGDAIWPTEERRVVSRAEDVAFTPDGKQIALVAGGDVYVMDRELREPRRVTDSEWPETEVVFSPDGKALYFLSSVGGQPDIWCAVPADPKNYWWLNDAFKITRVTNDPEVESNLRFRPDGKRFAFVRKGGELWTADLNGKNRVRVLEGWNGPRYRWSPDGKWLVYAVQDNDFNSDVWVAKADGSAAPYNISRHPDADSGPVWSPDGRKIAFVGRRTHRELDVYYVHLRKEDEQTSSRDRKLEKALEAMKKGAKKSVKGKGTGKPKKAEPGSGKGKAKSRPKKAEPEPGAAPAGAKTAPDDEKDAKKKKKVDKKKEKKAEKKVEVKIDFDGLHRRLHRIRVPNSFESNLIWSPDSKKLVFSATVKGVRGLYAVEIPGTRPSPKKFSSTVLTRARWMKKPSQLVGLSRGLPATMSASGAVKTYAFRVKQTVDLEARRTAAFDVAWYVMRERFYDGGFNNLDWDAIRRKYREKAVHCLGREEFGTLVNLMLGELNASHMGFSSLGRFGSRTSGATGWTPQTVHLGVRWDAAHPGPGLKVRDVIPKGPASLEKRRLEPGEIVLAIDGEPVSPDSDLTTVLNETTDHDYRLRVKSPAGKERTVTLRATTTRSVRRLLYEKRLEDRQKRVDRLSGGNLGYCHIAGMNWSSFERFEAELYAIGYGKDGLVIDVRDNGGGSTTDHLLTVLCQPHHAITVPRRGGAGYPHDRRVYATWQKPVVVLCNQNSYSNAEIFSHAIKALGRGQVVGVQTAGGVISTGGARVLDVGFVRTPFRAWFLLDGEDMELNGAMPDHVVWPRPGELPAGIDRQLEKAVAVLLEDVKKWKARPQPKLRYARERKEKKARRL